MVSTVESKCWLSTRAIADLSELPLALHLQLLQGVQHEDAGSIHKCTGHSIKLPTLSREQLALALILFAACWGVLTPLIQPDVQWSGYGEVFRQALGGFLLTWITLLLTDALILQHMLRGNQSVLKITWWGLRIDPIAWVLTQNAAVATESLFLPVIALLFATSSLVPNSFGLGMALCALMILSMRACPFSYGPINALLARRRGVVDFRKALRLALATLQRQPARNRRDQSRRLLLLGSVAGLMSALIVFCGGLLLNNAWPGMWVVALVLVLGVNARSLVRILFGAWKQRRRGSVHTLLPDVSLLRRWKENCAMIFHVPGLATLSWRWMQVDTGFTLVNFGQIEGSCYWVASGSLEILGRTDKGDLVELGALQAGTAIGADYLEECDISPVDVVALERTVVACLDVQSIRALPEESRRRLNSFIVMSQLFDRNPVLAGVKPVQKELWLAKGRMVWIPGGAVLMEAGEEATWMALLVQGALRQEGEGSLQPGDLVGDEILTGANRRLATMVTEVPTLVLRWEYGWVRQWVPQTNTGGDISDSDLYATR